MRPLPMIDDLSDHTVEAPPKQRLCLRCQDAFHSNWAGERVCPRCKGSSAWRQGSPLRSHPTGGHR